MAMVSAIQEAQKDNVRSFNDYMMRVLEVSAIQHVFELLV
jgi:nuclear pore complex protein Nup93